MWRACEIDKNRIDQISTDEIIVFENIEDLCNESVSVILLKNASVLYETLGKINQQSNDRSFDAYDLPLFQSVGKTVLGRDTGNPCDSSEEIHSTELLERNLANFN